MIFELHFPTETFFGAGQLRRLGEIASTMGRRVLLVTGKTFLQNSGILGRIKDDLAAHDLTYLSWPSEGEPLVETVDAATLLSREEGCDMVIAVGGGSVIDLGKAISGMVPNSGSVKDYLEGVGSGAVMKSHPIPLISVPTTAGTGSEATRNAVIASRKEGFKKSFRDVRLLPRVALVDPELTISCSPEITAADGMDALTQLVEPFTSPNVTPPIAALALSGIAAVGQGLLQAVEKGEDMGARTRMSYAAYLSGVALSHAGVGAVHALASPLGGLFGVPHAVACARLLPFATEKNLEAIREGRGEARAVSAYLEAETALGEPLLKYCSRFSFPPLSSFGVTKTDIPRIVAGTGSLKNNSALLTEEDLHEILFRAM
ncbi:MAG: iron-containing alcohol dehydrogenase [bacterium]